MSLVGSGIEVTRVTEFAIEIIVEGTFLRLVAVEKSYPWIF